MNTQIKPGSLELRPTACRRPLLNLLVVSGLSKLEMFVAKICLFVAKKSLRPLSIAPGYFIY